MIDPAPQSWEMPLRFLIRESFLRRAPFAGKEVDWQVSLVKVPASKWPILWLRPLVPECDAGFTAFDVYSDQTMFFAQRAKLSSLREKIDDVFNYELMARQFFLNDAGLLRGAKEAERESLVMGANGIAGWNLAFVRKEVHSPASFEWSKPLSFGEFRRLPAQSLWQRAQRLLQDPNGEVAFARGFALLGEEEQFARVQRTRRDTLGELQELLRDLAFVCPLWDATPGATGVCLFIDSRKDVSLWETSSMGHIEAPPFLMRGIQKLWHHFQPFDRKIATFRCVRMLHADTIRLDIERPTAHERLEAHLRWQEWEGKTR